MIRWQREQNNMRTGMFLFFLQNTICIFVSLVQNWYQGPTLMQRTVWQAGQGGTNLAFCLLWATPPIPFDRMISSCGCASFGRYNAELAELRKAKKERGCLHQE
jgi:hypothetical protein